MTVDGAGQVEDRRVRVMLIGIMRGGYVGRRRVEGVLVAQAAPAAPHFKTKCCVLCVCLCRATLAAMPHHEIMISIIAN